MLALVIFAAAATWAFLLVPLQRNPKQAGSSEAAPVAHDATPAEAAPIARVAPPVEPDPVAPTARTPAASAAINRPPATPLGAPVDQGDVRVLGSEPATAPALGEVVRPETFDPENAQATGELGEGVLSPDYRLLEESYLEEPRDGPWAVENELKIRKALMSSELAQRVVIVHCQSTVCRIHLEPQGSDPFGDLLKVPGLAAASGIDSSTPYSLNGSELIVYARPENAPPQPQ